MLSKLFLNMVRIRSLIAQAFSLADKYRKLRVHFAVPKLNRKTVVNFDILAYLKQRLSTSQIGNFAICKTNNFAHRPKRH